MLRYVLFTGLLAAALAAKSYEGYQVLRVTPSSDREVSVLSSIKKTIGEKVDFWQSPHAPGAPVDIMVSPEYRELITGFIKARGLRVETMIEDVEKLDVEQRTRPPSISSFSYTDYNTLAEINAWMDDFSATHAMVSIVEVGDTYEGRKIRALKIGVPQSTAKPTIWLEGGIHAREWISPATMIYMSKLFVEDYDNDVDVKNILDTLDVYMVINTNPDGYQYTWTNDRMWRKTRSPNANSRCVGVDPNRNWDYEWGGLGASTSPCAQDYRGPFAHSEIEIVSVTDYILGLNDVRVFADIHAYSQMWMTPWGYTYDLPDDFNEQDAVSADAVAAIKAKHGSVYVHGTISDVIYAASGSSADWAYGAANIKYSYAVELRDEGQYGFLLPATQIQATGEETFEAVKVICLAAM